ncbi:MAG: TetR/AcrR family transcriptional regulator [Coriobacteriales bacterium]|nr:TetR/AcrR family transcriptional regulator [Coriobacteriales bacterium]
MRKRPEKTEQTKEDLRVAFWRLYAERSAEACGKNPIDAITIQQISDLAGYNRATFYLHYHDIYEILEEIEADLLRGMTECVESCMRSLKRDSSKLSCIIELGKVAAFYERRKRYIVVLLGENGDPSFIVRLKGALKPIWREYLVSEGELEGRDAGEIELIMEYTLSGTLFMISQWLKDPNGVSAAQMGHLVYDMSIKDFASRLH